MGAGTGSSQRGRRSEASSAGPEGPVAETSLTCSTTPLLALPARSTHCYGAKLRAAGAAAISPESRMTAPGYSRYDAGNGNSANPVILRVRDVDIARRIGNQAFRRAQV